jgi:hypothetical protein
MLANDRCVEAITFPILVWVSFYTAYLGGHMSLLTHGVIEMTSDTIGWSHGMLGRFCLP